MPTLLPPRRMALVARLGLDRTPVRQPTYGSKKIFVIGTGRSGTHFVGEFLSSHPEIQVSVEYPPVFDLATSMALDPAIEADRFDALVRWYRRLHALHPDQHFADKSHPVVWFAQRLAEVFPEAVFVAVRRNPLSTVASMIRHPAVRDWHRRWREFPVPNRFLGIDEEIAARYETLDLAEQCALRWAAHDAEILRLGDAMSDRIAVLSYEQLTHDAGSSFAASIAHLGISERFDPPAIRPGTTEKWREVLTDGQVASVERVAAHAHEATRDRSDARDGGARQP